MTADEPNITDWEQATWEGSRRAQLRRWRCLSLREKLAAIDEMRALAERLNAGVGEAGAEIGEGRN